VQHELKKEKNKPIENDDCAEGRGTSRSPGVIPFVLKQHRRAPDLQQLQGFPEAFEQLPVNTKRLKRRNNKIIIDSLHQILRLAEGFPRHLALASSARDSM